MDISSSRDGDCGCGGVGRGRDDGGGGKYNVSGSVDGREMVVMWCWYDDVMLVVVADAMMVVVMVW